MYKVIFFFQAEDGIRDLTVTGVQTCALPILARQRVRVGLVAEAGDAWDVHHLAALFGYGAEAVHPWLALQCLRDVEASADKYRSAAEKGLLKILSKMGISTLQSYAGAQIFEAIGLGPEVIDRCFTGTASVIGGIGFK